MGRPLPITAILDRAAEMQANLPPYCTQESLQYRALEPVAVLLSLTNSLCSSDCPRMTSVGNSLLRDAHVFGPDGTIKSRVVRKAQRYAKRRYPHTLFQCSILGTEFNTAEPLPAAEAPIANPAYL